MLYDVIIIGSGPAGISASLYTKRANLKTLIISKKEGTLDKVNSIENYYGFSTPISGKQLKQNGINQAKSLGIQIIEDEVLKINYDSNFIIETVNNIYNSKTLIIATGASRNISPIKGIKEFEGKGISYCATCDAFFYKGKDVAVLGSGEYAISEAKELLPITKSVTIFTNGEKIIENRNINVEIEDRKIREVRGNISIEEVEFEDNTKKSINGIFIALGVASSSDLAKKIGARIDKKNNIIVDKNMSTTVPKLFACGDCTGGILQISKAVHEGMIAAMSVIETVRNNKN